jgi:hypothetical protein
LCLRHIGEVTGDQSGGVDAEIHRVCLPKQVGG